VPVRELVDLAVLGAGPAGATAAIAALRRRPDATDCCSTPTPAIRRCTCFTCGRRHRVRSIGVGAESPAGARCAEGSVETCGTPRPPLALPGIPR
jgi:hypothetical protein